MKISSSPRNISGLQFLTQTRFIVGPPPALSNMLQRLRYRRLQNVPVIHNVFTEMYVFPGHSKKQGRVDRFDSLAALKMLACDIMHTCCKFWNVRRVFSQAFFLRATQLLLNVTGACNILHCYIGCDSHCVPWLSVRFTGGEAEGLCAKGWTRGFGVESCSRATCTRGWETSYAFCTRQYLLWGTDIGNLWIVGLEISASKTINLLMSLPWISRRGERSPRGPGEERHLRTRQEEGGSHTGTDSFSSWIKHDLIEPYWTHNSSNIYFKRHCTTQLFDSLFDDRGAKVGGDQVSSKLGVCEAKKSTDEAIKKLEDAKKQLAEAALQDTTGFRRVTSRRVVGLCCQAGGKVSEAEAEKQLDADTLITYWPIDSYRFSK